MVECIGLAPINGLYVHTHGIAIFEFFYCTFFFQWFTIVVIGSKSLNEKAFVENVDVKGIMKVQVSACCIDLT